jgi:CheY-like chemotaxis protein
LRIIGDNFRPGDYVVIRSFGKTRRFEVTQGNHTFFGVVCIRVLESSQNDIVRKFRSTTAGKVAGYSVPLRWYGPKSRSLLDLLSGRPRLYAVTERKEALAIARSLPDVTLLDISMEAYHRFPFWLQFILLLPAAFALRALWMRDLCRQLDDY